MRKFCLLLCILLSLPAAGFAQNLASPYSNAVFPAQIFTATGQTGKVLQLNGLTVASTVGSSFASATITVTGVSLTTVTFTVQGSSDNGVTYFPLPVNAIATPSQLATTTTATTNGMYQVSLAGLTHIKLVTSGTFTATSVSITLTASPNALTSRNSGGGSGGGATLPPIPSVVVSVTSLTSRPGINGTDYLAPNTGCALAGCTLTGPFSGPRTSTSLNPDVNVQAYGALGTDGTAPGGYTAGSANITVPSGITAIPGWILILHDATTIGSAATVTGCSITAGVATLVANQSYRAAETVYISGLSGPCAGLNSATAHGVYQVLVNTNTATQFGVSTSLGNLASSSDSGSVAQTADLIGRVATISGTTITGSSVSGGPSMTPTITYSTSAVNNIGWAPDDTAFIQNAVNSACFLGNFPRGTVGLKYGRVLIPQGAFHITSTINVPNCGHIEGIGGAGGSRLISDIVPAGGTVFSFASNSSTYVANLELFADSKSFAPAKFFDVNALIDAESHWHDLTFSFAATQCTICLENGFLNLDWSNINIRNFTGDAIRANISTVQNRSHFTIRGGTLDTGSQLAIQTGLTVNSCVNFVIPTGATGGFGNVLLSDMRIEDQSGTQWTGANPMCIRYTTGGAGGIPAVVGQPRMEDMDFNLLSPSFTSKPIYAMGTDDPTSTNCPTPQLHQINQNRGLAGGWTSASGTWCGGVPIAHVPEIDHGLLDIPDWNPNPGGDPNSVVYAGNPPQNLARDSGFHSPSAVIWTVDPAYTLCAHCGQGGSQGYVLTGTGSPIGFPHIISPLIPVATGELYYFNGGTDCTNIPSGNTGWLLEDQTGTPLAATPNGNCTAGQNSNQGQPKYITVPSGVTGLFMVTTPGNAIIPNGLTETFSRPQLNLLSPTNALPVPYSESPYTPSVASTTAPGVAKCGAGISCAADGTMSTTGATTSRTMLCRTTTDINVTGVTAQTLLAVCAVPPNTLGVNGQIFVSADFTAQTAAVGCNYTARLTTSSAGLSAGPSINSNAVAGIHYTHLIFDISDRNSTAAQFLAGQFSGPVNSVPGGNSTTGTQAMTVQQFVALTVTPSNAADTCTLNQSTVEYIP